MVTKFRSQNEKKREKRENKNEILIMMFDRLLQNSVHTRFGIWLILLLSILFGTMAITVFVEINMLSFYAHSHEYSRSYILEYRWDEVRRR